MAKFSVSVGIASPALSIQWEDGSTGRPVLVCIHDTRTRKVLVSRIGVCGPLLAQEAFAALVSEHGVPDEITTDDSLAIAFAAEAFAEFAREGRSDV